MRAGLLVILTNNLSRFDYALDNRHIKEVVLKKFCVNKNLETRSLHVGKEFLSGEIKGNHQEY